MNELGGGGVGAVGDTCECRWTHREDGEPVGEGLASGDGAREDAGEVAFAPALAEEFLGGAAEPAVGIAILKTLFE